MCPCQVACNAGRQIAPVCSRLDGVTEPPLPEPGGTEPLMSACVGRQNEQGTLLPKDLRQCKHSKTLGRGTKPLTCRSMAAQSPWRIAASTVRAHRAPNSPRDRAAPTTWCADAPPLSCLRSRSLSVCTRGGPSPGLHPSVRACPAACWHPFVRGSPTPSTSGTWIRHQSANALLAAICRHRAGMGLYGRVEGHRRPSAPGHALRHRRATRNT